MGYFNMPELAVGIICLNGNDVMITARSCGDVDVGSIEVSVRFAEGSQEIYDIGVCVYCHGKGIWLTRGMLSNSDKVALDALSEGVGMNPEDVLADLVAASEAECDRSIRNAVPG
jgi:hypothetical protein